MTGSGAKPLRVSIVLSVHNESSCLPGTIRAVRAQECSAEVELVLVDSGSTDGTQDTARRLRIDSILSLAPADFSFGRALNWAAQHATGDILVILSAHARPAHERWLENLLRHFRNHEVGGVYGRQIPQPDAWPPVVVDYQRCYGDTETVHEMAGNVFFSNANSALRRRLWEQVPFNEELAACEDQEWARRIVSLGYQVVYEPLATVSHSHNDSLRQLYRRRAREERGWRQILPNRKGNFGRFLDDWFSSTRADLLFVVRSRKSWRWLLRSPIYRLVWALGQWYPYW